jgi:hypothetical protein
LANILDMHSNISSTTCVKLRAKNGNNHVKKTGRPFVQDRFPLLSYYSFNFLY